MHTNHAPNNLKNKFEKFNWPLFFKRGYCLASPLLKKVWCLYDETTSNSIKQNKIGAEYLNFFYKNNFQCSSTKPWISGSNFYEFKIHDFFQEISKFDSEVPNIIWHDKKNLKHKKTYQKLFNAIKEEIQKSIIKKAVPFYKEEGTSNITQKNLIHFFKCFKPYTKNKELFFFGSWNFKQKKFHFGVSPELLFIKNNNIIKTIALAGTAKDPKKEFKSTKIQHEHNYVIQDLCTELQKYGTVQKQPTKIVPFKNFFHKKTQITVNCHSIKPNFADLLKSVYPSAAIGAYPRLPGQVFLQQLENKFNATHGFFAAPFGVRTLQKKAGIMSEFMICISMIRGIEYNGKTISVTAGGGVVSESIFETEWKEIMLKIKSIKSFFQ